MFVLKHGSREQLVFVRSIKIDVTGLDVSFSNDVSKAMQFVSRAAAIQVAKALRHSYGNYYLVEV
ncbi:hypothetical protein EAF07_08100 [Streptococcus hillyeri]|uniref:Uncharacterized protein n=1 Tax=Streptococcus hillyeri TaxID=2282420 RepID=A0A3L9DQH3_9STRE|nr:hypothetical protein EAF07_08100 [Streptococcus hillyeri]